MAIPHLSSGEVASILPLGGKLERTRTTALFKAPGLEVMHIVLLAGKGMPPHAVAGPITVQCLEGVVDFVTGDTRTVLRAGDLLYLAAGVTHEVTAAEDASLLVTVVLVGISGVAGGSGASG